LYDIRSTRDMVAFFKSIGFTNQEIINGFYHYPKQIIDFNRERENMVVQGVKVIKGATDFSDVRHDDEENIDEGLYGDDVFFEDDSLGEDLSLKYDEFCENDLDGEDEL
ncbi:MAG: ribonuclease P subunit P30, partial [Methanobrevibacter sp.]|nr:ribonuclease P subunit P30 [Methanobrevibacter sp.]